MKKALSGALVTVSFSFLLAFFSHSLVMFVISNIVLALSNALVQPLINTILSRETDDKSQGTIMGINASYMSIGQILGPIVGGAVATIAIPYPFLAGSLVLLLCFALSFYVLKTGVRKESAF